MSVLIGVLIVILGFGLRINPLVVIALACGASGYSAHLSPLEIISAFGKAFKDNRFITAIWVMLCLIGLLERQGLQEKARSLMSHIKAATAGRVLLIYLFLRQISSALGLTALGGHAQMVRPLIAPMAESAAENQSQKDGLPLSDEQRDKIKAMAAATDNIGLFFGEDIFIAIGSILLMTGFLSSQGLEVEPLKLALWAIPTAIAAALIHGLRLFGFDKKLANQTRGKDA